MPRKPRDLPQKSLLEYLTPGPSAVQGASSPTRQLHSFRARRKGGRGQNKARATHYSEDSEVHEGRESSADIAAIPFEPDVVEISDDDEVVSPRRQPTQRPVSLRRACSTTSGDSVAVPSDSEEREVGVPITWKGKKRASPRKRAQDLLRSDSEDSNRPKRRKLIKGERPLTPEADLLQELDADTILNTRLRSRGRKSTYLFNLEKMKRKKRNEDIDDDTPHSESDECKSVPFSHASPHEAPIDDEDSSASMNEEEDGFIVEDGDNVQPELPVEFSMSTYQDLTHHFKIICQLFVHLAVQHDKDRAEFMQRAMEDRYFSVSFQIARRKICGMRDSMVASSVWQANYKRNIETYPTFNLIALDFTEPSCDACRFGGRVSTLAGRLSGNPYDRLSFEPLSGDDSSSSESSKQDDGPIKKEYHLGRFCARRTQVYHEFTHWEYTLFQAISQEIDDLKTRLSRENRNDRVYLPIAYVGNAQPPDSLEDADEVMEWLDGRQIIARELHRLNQMMESALNLEIASKRGEED